MTIDKELEAKILRYHFVEKWKVGTISQQLSVHHNTVNRVLSQVGLPKVERARRPCMIDPYLPFIIETLEQYPSLTASRLQHVVLSGHRVDQFELACIVGQREAVAVERRGVGE